MQNGFEEGSLGRSKSALIGRSHRTLCSPKIPVNKKSTESAKGKLIQSSQICSILWKLKEKYSQVFLGKHKDGVAYCDKISYFEIL